jgi:hypothetical protein
MCDRRDIFNGHASSGIVLLSQAQIRAINVGWFQSHTCLEAIWFSAEEEGSLSLSLSLSCDREGNMKLI